MANIDAPFGFRPVGQLGSSIQNAGTTRYRIADNQSGAIFQGDPVYFGDASTTDANGGTPALGYIGACAAGNTAIAGVFNGCFITKHPTTGKPFWSNYYPGSINVASGEKIYAFVYDDPNRLYVVQSAGTLTSPGTDGSNIEMATYAAGSTVNGQSNVEINTAIVASGATGQFVIIGICEDPDNSDTANDNANWIVKINEGRFLKYTSTQAVPAA